MTTLERKLKNGEIVLLDGAIGTELQRRGAPMNRAAWCATATDSHPDLLRQIHADYIRVGVDVITANTFANLRHLLAPVGLGDAVPELTTRAVEIAREARERYAGDRSVAVMGSLSTMLPVAPGTDDFDPALSPDLPTARESYRETADLLAEAGVDMIALEMMGEIEHASCAVEAALATGLPVWVGFSCRVDEAGRVLGYREEGVAFDEMVDHIMPLGPAVAGVMHTSINDTPPALQVLSKHWSGPVAAYPESGYFKMPDWQFVDIIDPQDFAEHLCRWAAAGVQIVGGCCGIGPRHIEVLKHRLPRRSGS